MKTKAQLILALKIWIALYPSITLFLFLLGKPLSEMHLYQRTFLLTITLVPWIVFVGVPLLDWLLKKALTKKNEGTF